MINRFSARALPAWALAALVVTTVPAQADGENWLERLLFNARERTARGIEALRGATNTDAIAPLDSALRLRGDNPVSQFNAGTARLREHRGDAVPLLEAAAQTEDPRLAAHAAYNLGNAHLDQGNYEPAIDAFKTALRHDPATAAAKHNLELAQKLLEQQQQDQQDGEQDQQDQQDQQDGEQDQQDQQDGEQDQQDQQDDEQDQQDQQDGEQDQQDQQDGEQDQQDGEQQDGEQQQERPLPQFQDLPDMTAEEAAAILEAVENLEREARRQEALEAAAQAQATGKKDW